MTGFASPGPLHPRGSFAPSALCFCHDLHGLVSCRARSWGYALRSFPLRGEGPRLSTPSCPPAVGSSGRALPRTPSPGSWALLPPEVRCTTEEWSLQPARCSLGLRLSRGRPPPRWRPASRRLLPRASRDPVRTAAAPRSLDRGGVRRSPWRSPPLLRFLHLVPHPAIRSSLALAHRFASNPFGGIAAPWDPIRASVTPAAARWARRSVLEV